MSFGCFDILYTCGMVYLIPCFYLLANLFFPYIVYMFLGSGQKAWPFCFLGTSYIPLESIMFFCLNFVIDLKW